MKILLKKAWRLRGYRGGQPKASLSLLFEPRDTWLGVYWNAKRAGDELIGLDIYVCLLPMLPIRLELLQDYR